MPVSVRPRLLSSPPPPPPTEADGDDLSPRRRRSEPSPSRRRPRPRRPVNLRIADMASLARQRPPSAVRPRLPSLPPPPPPTEADAPGRSSPSTAALAVPPPPSPSRQPRIAAMAFRYSSPFSSWSWRHLRRNPYRRKKRQKKSIFIYGTTFKKNESGRDFQRGQIWNDRSQKQKKNYGRQSPSADK